MRRLNPEHVRAVAALVNHSPYFSLLSMEVLDLSMGGAHLKIAVHEKHLQPFGMVHGGVYASLIDAAAFWACYCEVEEGRSITTVEMKLNYLAPTSKGVLDRKGPQHQDGKDPLPCRCRHRGRAGKTPGPRDRHHDGPRIHQARRSIRSAQEVPRLTRGPPCLSQRTFCFEPVYIPRLRRGFSAAAQPGEDSNTPVG